MFENMSYEQPKVVRYEMGSLPSFAGKKTEEKISPEVMTTREGLINLISEQMPYIDEEKVKSLSSKELIQLYLYYFNNKFEFKHFTNIIEIVGNPKYIKFLDKVKTSGEDTSRYSKDKLQELKSAYLIYLYNKLPFSLRERQFAMSKDKKEKIQAEDVLEELDFEEPQRITEPELRAQADQLIDKLEKLAADREEKYGHPVIAFHTSNSDELKKISVAHGVPQTNLNAPANQELVGGEKFFNYRLDKLYPGKFLYLVFSNTHDAATKVYDEESTAAAAPADLEIISREILPPIALTEYSRTDLGAAYGAK